jgi:hypothetical protein
MIGRLVPLAIVLVSMWAGIGQGAIVVVAESKTAQSDPNHPVTSFFDVYFSVSGDNPSVSRYQVRLDLVGASALLTFGSPISTGKGAPPRTPLFPTAPTDLGSTASRIEATDSLAEGAKQVANLDGMVRIPFVMAPGITGTYSLNIHPEETSLSDELGNPIAFQIVNGALNVVPEPSALVLAAVFLAAGTFGIMLRKSH